MRRIKITIEYNGKNYVGWQKQDGLSSIQGKIEEALEKALQEKIEIVGSGRTDAGVNALGQVAHFDTNSDLEPNKIKFATNFYLPEDIKIVDAEIASDDFHARFSAKQKTYVYKMYFADFESPLLKNTHLKLWHNIDYQSMIDACKHFIGTHDFVGFCEINPQVTNTIRTIYDCHIEKQENCLIFSITGTAFLHKMVRIIVGTIIKVGERKIKESDLPEIINSKIRQKAGHTAPAFALTLKKVEY